MDAITDNAEVAALFDRFDWRAPFDARTLARAERKVERGDVLDLSFDGVGAGEHADPTLADRWFESVGSVLGTVLGSRDQCYECEVTVLRSSVDHRLVVLTECDCPVGVACKHAAATIIAAQRVYAGEPRANHPLASAPAPEPPADLGPWQRWLATLAPFAGPVADAERRFGLLLRSDHGTLIVLPAWLRPSKNAARNGHLVDPQMVELNTHHGAVPTPQGGWPPEVAADLVTLLHARPTHYGNAHWRVVESTFVEHALERLLAHYPAWYERGSRPIERGEALIPELYWTQHDDATQQLELRLPVADAVIARAARLWYIRPKPGLYGLVAGDSELLSRLQRAPPLDPRQAAAVRSQLAQASAAPALPLPVDHGDPIRVSEPPVGVIQLRVMTLEHWNRGARRVAVARLKFDYGDLRIDTDTGSPQVRRFKAGRVYLIERDRDQERACAARLADTKLKRIGRVDLYMYDVPYATLSQDDFVVMKRDQPLPPEDFKPTIEALEKLGFRLEYATDFPRDELVDIDDWYGELGESGNAWFDVALGIVVGGERIDLLPILRQLLADPSFPRIAPKREKAHATWRVKLDETRAIELPLTRLRALIEPLLEWLETEHEGPPRVHKSRAGELDAMPLPWLGGEALRAQLERLAQARQPARTPRGFQGTLRPYQQDGLAWLNFLAAAGLGGILADDMGLGKTVQVLAHILSYRQQRKPDAPVLVVAPTSLVGNWRAETRRFAPALKVLVIHGAGRADRFADIPAHDLVITTYPLLRHDRDQLVEAKFSLLVLDEAQAIKNAHSQAAQVVRELHAQRRLAMTGTPLENHLGELWAQFDAVEPGLLGSERQFRRLYRTPIEKHGDADRQQRLNRRIGSLLLRRRKDDVLTDLPPKNEIVRTLELDGAQRELYETLRLAQHERVREAIAKRGMAQAGIIVLDALLKLRQACCDPRLVKLQSARKVKESAKLDALLELLDGLLDEGRRVLLFSQFTSMLALIQLALDKRGTQYQTLTGQTPGGQRTALVERFQRGDVPVFLISLKAGGVGLNLTAADTVIHYDPWWNPAVEAQATDRAHRIGQDKPVFVYRLICAGTVEEKIQALQTRKAELAKAVLEGGATQRLRFDEADLAELFGPT